jgi:hypothetical protein
MVIPSPLPESHTIVKARPSCMNWVTVGSDQADLTATPLVVRCHAAGLDRRHHMDHCPIAAITDRLVCQGTGSVRGLRNTDALLRMFLRSVQYSLIEITSKKQSFATLPYVTARPRVLICVVFQDAAGVTRRKGREASVGLWHTQT